MAARRSAPRPMPRPVRWLAMFLAFVFVVSLGVVVNHSAGKASDGTDDRSASSSAATGSGKGASGSDGYAGLKAAGLPAPGKWSRQSLISTVKGKDGKRTAEAGQSVGKGGPVDVALETVNSLLDPKPSDDEWSRTVQGLFQDDLAGESHGPSNMARYWWRQRRADPDLLCTGRSSDLLIVQSYNCSTDHEYQGDAHGMVKGTQAWTQGSDKVFFDVPESISSSIGASTDPQTAVSKYYDAVAFPMDDGMWYVTVECPASGDQPILDDKGDETDYGSLDDVPAGKRVWISDGSVGVGTNQRPCQPVEITVGGQKPFWYIGTDEGD